MRGLYAPPRNMAAPRTLHRVRCIEQLRPRFHRTWSSDHHHVRAADGYIANLHHRTLWPYLPTYQFERLSDGDHIVHARSDLKRFDFVAPSAAHCSDDGALRASRHVGLIARFANALDNVVDFLLGSFF